MSHSEPPTPAPADARRSAPATARNAEPLLAVLEPRLARARRVLEVASGTGEHAVRFAMALPHLLWQPSDPDPELRASIEAWTRETGAPVPAPLDLDVMQDAWWDAVDRSVDAIVCINMIHIAPWAAAHGLIAGAGRLLGPGGRLFLYGPFKVSGRHTADSNARFDASLRARDTAWGVRDLDDVAALAEGAGLRLAETVAMPANNLTVVFEAAGRRP